MEADLGALVSPAFFETTHGKMDCRECHGGVKFAATRAEAHGSDDFVARPSGNYEDSVCIPCHEQIATTFSTTLHADTRGVSGSEESLVLARGGDDPVGMEAVQKGLETNCATCHVSGCGDCHVTRPAFNDGGFINGHVFSAQPNSSLNCMGCHGSRIEKEYTGKGVSTKGETLKADVHWAPGGLQCYDCHPQEWIHGGDEYDARYDAPKAPKCTDCHPQNASFAAAEMHEAHGMPDSKVYLQCQVCHAQEYNNCVQCHVATDDKDVPYFVSKASWFDFNIGKNYDKSESKPWDYVVVRHVPVFEGTFDFYGEGGLPNMDAAPTWKYATPHTIQTITRQTRDGCDGCHDNKDLFLSEDDFKSIPEGMTTGEEAGNQPVLAR